MIRKQSISEKIIDVSFISTFYNERNSILEFLNSLFEQSVLPSEIVFVDGGSTDDTVLLFKKYVKNKKIPRNIKLKLIRKTGNRSVGRNEAVRHSVNEIIVCSDVGCILDKEWIKEITLPFQEKRVQVVAGYYKPIANNPFEKALAAYTSVMPDRLDPKKFLPSSRSIAFRRSAWMKANGYPEHLDYCEDLVFARKLKHLGLKFFFAQKAVVNWPQKTSLYDAFFQFYHYAVGDGQAKYIRFQTPFLFLRYFIGVGMLFTVLLIHSTDLAWLLTLCVFIYLGWAIEKNFRYVRTVSAFYILPLLQICSDIAILTGMTKGFLSRGDR